MRLFSSVGPRADKSDIEIMSVIFRNRALKPILRNGLLNFLSSRLKKRLKCYRAISIEKIQDKTVSFFYFNNPDGTIRWIIPSSEKEPLFLNMHYGGTRRAIAIRVLFSLVYRLKLQPFFADGYFNLSREDLRTFNTVLSKSEATSYAIFTGTKGDHRTGLVALVRDGKANYFYKTPLSKRLESFNREIDNLKAINEKAFKEFKVPTIERFGDGILLSNIAPENLNRSNRITIKHIAVLTEIYDKTYQPQMAKAQIDFVSTRIQGLLSGNFLSQVNIDVIEEKLELLESVAYSSALMHGDFTPWNMYLDEELIYLYDWENASQAPLFFDIYHFIFQTESFIYKRFSVMEIEREIERVMNLNTVKDLIAKYSIDVKKHLILYLLYVIAFYSERYLIDGKSHGNQIQLWTNYLKTIT
jgi:hypothetical protein